MKKSLEEKGARVRVYSVGARACLLAHMQKEREGRREGERA